MTTTLDLTSLDLSTRRSLTELSLSVIKSKRIVVVTGAGISCSCGIPDFRSSDGLYNLVKQKYPDVVLKGRDLFDASLFRDPASTAVFYTFISQLKQSIDKATPTATHRFIKALDTKRKLLRSYTQNIDGLEEKVGLRGTSNREPGVRVKSKSQLRSKDIKNVQLHGDIHRVRCTFCSAEFPCNTEHLNAFNDGVPPNCPDCTTRSKAREARSARPLKIGTLRPAIVLYDEIHPLGDEIGAIQTADLSRKPDLLIIMGTSLKVHGLRKLVKEFAKSVHESSSSSAHGGSSKGKVVFVNKTAPPGDWAGIIDYHVGGETDRWVDKVLEDWKRMRPADWEVQTTLIAGDGAVEFSGFKTVKNVKLKEKAHKKKPAPDSENIPPTASPKSLKNSKCSDSISKPRPSTPLSPNKRPQGSCHYSDVESSPSKRRSSPSLAENMTETERALLFVKDGVKVKPRSESTTKRKVTQAKEDEPLTSSNQLTRTKSKVWVEMTSKK